jgi:phospholipid-binding lipoprotein MlaA
MLAVTACPRPGLAAVRAAGAPIDQGNGLTSTEDPFERLNRNFYHGWVNTDRAVMRPLALGYARYTPKVLQKGLRNVLTEVHEPQAFANSMVQFRFRAAGRTLLRFIANATVGLGGLFDPASHWGLAHEDNGFGDTLGRWGMKPGPYVFLPLFGPGDFRDMIGEAVDFLTDPVGWGHYEGDAAVRGSVWVVSGLDQRAQSEDDLERIEDMATDSYAAMRSYYLQNREAEIRGNAQVKLEDLPDLEEVPAPPSTPTPRTPAEIGPHPLRGPAEAAPAAAASAAPAAAIVTSKASGDVAAFLADPAAGRAPSVGAPIQL